MLIFVIRLILYFKLYIELFDLMCIIPCHFTEFTREVNKLALPTESPKICSPAKGRRSSTGLQILEDLLGDADSFNSPLNPG